MEPYSSDQPEHTPGESIFDFTEGDEFSDVAERLRQFDESREMVYTQLTDIMQGKGGSTLPEATEVLAALVNQTAAVFGELGDAVIKEHGGELMSAVDVISNIYMTDEKERLDVVKLLNDKAKYVPTEHQSLIAVLNDVLEECTPDEYESALKALYVGWMTNDCNCCIQGAPENIYELEAYKKELRLDRLKSIAIEAGRVAATSILTAVIVNKFKK